MAQRTIFHVDLNSFFASVEQQDNPALRGVPVGILKSAGRSCVIACSDEAKTFRVRTGMSLSDVRSLCPQIKLVPARFDRYEEVTREFMRACNHYSDLVEVFSLDEVFLDATHIKHLFGGSLPMAADLQEQIAKKLGQFIGCSIGIAENKLLSKMASGMAPRKGILLITEQNRQWLLDKAPFNEVCGIGHRLTKRLKVMGIKSLPEIDKTPLKLLTAEFGPFWAVQLKCLSRGLDETPLVSASTLPDAKSVSRTFTLFADCHDQFQIKAVISNLTEEAVFKLRKMGLVGRQFGLTIRGGGNSQSGYLTTKTYSSSGSFIFNQLYQLYQRWSWREPVRFVGVWISLLTRESNLPLPLFVNDQKESLLNRTVDRINGRYGYHRIHPANMLGSRIIRPEINGYLGDKQFRLGVE